MHFTEAIKEIIYGQPGAGRADEAASEETSECAACGTQIDVDAGGGDRPRSCPACGTAVPGEQGQDPDEGSQ